MSEPCFETAKSADHPDWNAPGAPLARSFAGRAVAKFNGKTVASSTRTTVVHEANCAPVYYFPMEDVRTEYLIKSDRHTYCEWKGRADYFHVVVGDSRADDAAWSYPDPPKPLARIAGCVAFYADKMEACYLDGQRVAEPEHEYYGGWKTKKD